jgi:protein-S-isoprenylcysteine O-methyltransferase Ste14
MGLVLLIPFLLIRFGLLALLDGGAAVRAAHYPPQFQANRAAYAVYQLSTAVIFLVSPFLPVRWTLDGLFYLGAAVYVGGIVLLTAAMFCFASPGEDGMNRAGLYRFSRNPMYVAYFVYFMGCVLLTCSPVLFGAAAAFQISGHWLILGEEAWCIQQFGQAYVQYMREVRRYF